MRGKLTDEIAALQWAADEARAQANLILYHAREAVRRARKYDRMLSIALATKDKQ